MENLIYKILAIVVMLMVTTSCDNFLAEEPRDVVSPNNFFTSDREAESAVNGLYRTYQNFNMYGHPRGLHHYYEYGAETVGPNRHWGGVESIGNYTLDEGNYGGARGTWQDLYSVVQNANLIISRISGNESISESARNQSLGETLFLRSFAYYHLTNLWGNVPYYRESLPLAEVQELGRTDKAKIREEILQDLQQASELLPGTYPDSERGRATMWAAKTLMVKINLWLKNWEAARDEAVDIINNSPHRLLDNYADVFDSSNEYNNEIIFEIVFAKDLMSQRGTDVFTPRIRDEPEDDSERGALQDALAARNEGFTGYGLGVALPDLVNSFPANDLRRQVTIVDNYLGFDLNFPYFGKLWNLDQINSPRGNHGDNFVVFRLADVYLMAAEAENELNGPANAYQYINKVRERAYDSVQPLSGLTQQQFRESLRNERKWELAAEGHRRMDLIRWGILLDVVKNAEYRVFNPASNIQPHHVLLPIPVEELQLNPQLLESDPTNNGYR